MPNKLISDVCLTALIFCIFASMAGCNFKEKTSGMMSKMSNMVSNTSPAQQRAKDTTSSMEDTQEELMDAKGLIEDTMTALNSLVQADGETLRKQYKKFVKEMGNTKDQCEKIRETSKDMDTQGNNFFTAWEQDLVTFENSDIRKRSEERRTESLESYNKMTGTVNEAIEAFESFLKSLDDIQKYLDIDLTRAGVSFISTQISKTKENASTVKSSIDEAISEIDRMIGEMPPS